jgi:hypothetical protein
MIFPLMLRRKRQNFCFKEALVLFQTKKELTEFLITCALYAVARIMFVTIVWPTVIKEKKILVATRINKSLGHKHYALSKRT